jgi:hypothetical protein
VEPDVNHGATCTCHWTYVRYPEPIGGCVGSCSMNRVALSTSVGAGDESVEVTARGSATSMGTQWLESQPHLKGVVVG